MATNVLTKQFVEAGVFRDRQRFNPDVQKAETKEQGNNTVIEAFTSAIDNPSTGIFEIQLAPEKYKDNLDYVTTWTYSVSGKTFQTDQYWDPLLILTKPQIQLGYCT